MPKQVPGQRRARTRRREARIMKVLEDGGWWSAVAIVADIVDKDGPLRAPTQAEVIADVTRLKSRGLIAKDVMRDPFFGHLGVYSSTAPRQDPNVIMPPAPALAWV